MIDIKLGPIETRFAAIIWANEPLTTNQLTKLCLEQLEWKRTTTYTVLKKLCDKGLFRTENSLWLRPSGALCLLSSQPSAPGRSCLMRKLTNCRRSLIP